MELVKKEETMDKGIEKLKELAESTTEIALIAQDKLKELGEKKEEPGETKEEGEYKDVSDREGVKSDDPEKED